MYNQCLKPLHAKLHEKPHELLFGQGGTEKSKDGGKKKGKAAAGDSVGKAEVS